MLAGGFAPLMSGKYLARDGANFLVDFLRKTLEARYSPRQPKSRRLSAAARLTAVSRSITLGSSRENLK
jgi:hypothetical protein